jgi:beta-glucosidase
VSVRATIKNVGARDAVETVQLYIRLRGTSVARPVRELKGFERVSLRAGEAREVTFTLGREQLAFWNIDMKRVVEPGALTVWIAPDARSGTPTEIVIAE